MDNEFNFYDGEGEDSYPALTEAGFHQGHGRDLSCGSSYETNMYSPPTQVPLLTNGQIVSIISTYLQVDVVILHVFIIYLNIAHHALLCYF